MTEPTEPIQPPSPTSPASPASSAPADAPPAAAHGPAATPTAPAQPAAHAPRQRAPVMLHMPVDVRNVSLALLALFASVALLHWASAVFIPIMLSLLLTTALRPTVEALWRWHVPRRR